MSSSEIPRGDLVQALTELAASNERLCRLALKADELAKAAEVILRDCTANGPLARALEAFKIERGGS